MKKSLRSDERRVYRTGLDEACDGGRTMSARAGTWMRGKTPCREIRRRHRQMDQSKRSARSGDLSMWKERPSSISQPERQICQGGKQSTCVRGRARKGSCFRLCTGLSGHRETHHSRRVDDRSTSAIRLPIGSGTTKSGILVSSMPGAFDLCRERNDLKRPA